MAHNISRFIDPRNGWCTQEIPKKWTEMGRFQFLTPGFCGRSAQVAENETLIHAPRFFNAKKKKALRKPHYLLRSGRFSVVRCVDCVGCHVFVLFEITFRGTHILLLEQSGRLII